MFELWNNEKIFIIDRIASENYSPDSYHLQNQKIGHFQNHVTSVSIRVISLKTYVLCLDILSLTLFSRKTSNYSQWLMYLGIIGNVPNWEHWPEMG